MSRWGALQEPNFRLYFVGQLTSLVADGMVTVALAFAVLDIGSVADLGIVLSARAIPLVVFVLAGGVFADRFSRRAVMVAADVVRGGAQATTAALLLTGSAEVWQIALLQAVVGFGTAFFSPASTGLIPLVVSAPRLQQGNALRSLAESIGRIGGPALAGVLVALVGPGWALVADAASYGVSAVTLARLRLPAHARVPGTSFLHELREGWSEFRARSWVFSITISAGIGALFWGPAYLVLGPAVANAELGGAAVWGAIAACGGAGAVVGGVLALRLRPERPVLVASLFVVPFPAPLVLLALHAPAPLVAADSFVTGMCAVVFAILFDTALQQHVPEQALSRVTSYDWFGSLALEPVGMALVGPVALALGVEETLWLAAAAVFATTLVPLAVPGVWRVRAR